MSVVLERSREHFNLIDFCFITSMKDYDWDGWASWELLPFGWEAIAVFVFGLLGPNLGMRCLGILHGVVGLVGRKGRDVGYELTALVCGVAVPLFRCLER